MCLYIIYVQKKQSTQIVTGQQQLGESRPAFNSTQCKAVKPQIVSRVAASSTRTTKTARFAGPLVELNQTVSLSVPHLTGHIYVADITLHFPFAQWPCGTFPGWEGEEAYRETVEVPNLLSCLSSCRTESRRKGETVDNGFIVCSNDEFCIYGVEFVSWILLTYMYTDHFFPRIVWWNSTTLLLLYHQPTNKMSRFFL